MYDSLIYLGVAMVVLYAIGLLIVLAWVLGSIWGFVSVLPELLSAFAPAKPRKVIRKKSRLP